MAKKILKIVYLAFALIMAFLVYIIGYNSNGYSHIQKLTADALNDKNYVDIAKIFGGCFDTRNLVTSQNDVCEVAIFPSTTLSQISYYKDSESSDIEISNTYNNSYYIYIFNPSTSLQTVDYKNSKGELMNDFGIRFQTASGDYYDYKFKISSTVNSYMINDKPLSVKDVILNGERDLFTSYTNWGFYSLTLTSPLIDAMDLDGNITSISILDSCSNNSEHVKCNIDVNLDFSQEFFDDVKDLVKNYNQYIEDSNSEDSTIKDNAANKFNEFYDGNENTLGFEEKFLSNPNYSFRYEDKYLQPTKLIFQTLGILVLYLVCVALIYVLLFHFARIRDLVTRNRGTTKNYGSRKTVEKKLNNKNVIDTKPTVIEEANVSTLNSENTLPDTKVEENTLVEKQDDVEPKDSSEENTKEE